MSSLLNVSNGSSNKSEQFNLNDIGVIVDNKEQNWFKRAHVGNFLGIVNLRRSTANLVDEDQKTRAFLQAEEGAIYVTDRCHLCYCKLSKRQGQST